MRDSGLIIIPFRFCPGRPSGHPLTPWCVLALIALSWTVPSRLAAAVNGLGPVRTTPSPITKDANEDFPITPIGQTSTLCQGFCFCNGPCNGFCDGRGSGTVQLTHPPALPFSVYGYVIRPFGSAQCGGGTPVQLPAFVDVGQELGLVLSFSPSRTGSFSDFLELNDFIFNLRGSTPSGSPDIVPYRPAGWSDAIIVSNTRGSHVDSSPLASSPLYVSWAVANDGSAPTALTFYPTLYLDGAFLQFWRADPPFAPGNFGTVADYQFGPLTSGSHTLRLSPDSTNTLGLSHDYTKTFTIGQTPAGVRLVAKSMNLFAPQASVTRTQKVDLSGSPAPLTFAVGEGFSLQAVQINSDGSDGPGVSSTTAVANQSSAPPPVTTSLEKSPTILFPGRVVLAFSQEPQNFVPVHSGTATISLTTSSGSTNVSIQVTAAGKLGDATALGHSLDGAISGYSDLRGIPPQVVKAVIQTESSFSTTAYRYEPLTIDFLQISTKRCGTTVGCIDDLRVLDKYKMYTMPTFGDSANNALPQGSGLLANEVSLRERYSVTLDGAGNPLRTLLNPPSRNSSKRKIKTSDGPISMEDILYTNNTSSVVPGGWYTTANPSQEPAFRAYRAQNAHQPFTAQTVLAASYGLMQATIPTAVADGYTTGGNCRQPSGLFDKNTNLDLGTEILASKYSGLAVSDQFAHVADLRVAWRTALVRYNGGGAYGPKVLTLSTTYFPIH